MNNKQKIVLFSALGAVIFVGGIIGITLSAKSCKPNADDQNVPNSNDGFYFIQSYGTGYYKQMTKGADEAHWGVIFNLSEYGNVIGIKLAFKESKSSPEKILNDTEGCFNDAQTSDSRLYWSKNGWYENLWMLNSSFVGEYTMTWPINYSNRSVSFFISVSVIEQ